MFLETLLSPIILPGANLLQNHSLQGRGQARMLSR